MNLKGPAAVAGLMIVLPLSALLVHPANASQVAYRDTDLEGALAEATRVVRGAYLGGEHPARFRVTRSTMGPALARRQVIHVYTSTAEAWGVARMHFERDGVRVSPLVWRLPSPPSASLTRGQSYCLLLREGKAANEFVLSVDGAHVAAPCGDLRALVRERLQSEESSESTEVPRREATSGS